MLFNFGSLEEFKKELLNKNNLFLYGFSYCHKPKECPKDRFSSFCEYFENSPICNQCMFGKIKNSIHEDDIFTPIKDVNFIANKILELKKTNRNREVIFILTACNLSIKMFSDLANMLNLRGLSIQLRGRTCINFNSFLLSERFEKKNLTSLSDESINFLFETLKIRHNVLINGLRA